MTVISSQTNYGLSPFKLDAQTNKVLSWVVLPYCQRGYDLVKNWREKNLFLTCYVAQDQKTFGSFPILTLEWAFPWFSTSFSRVCTLLRHFGLKKISNIFFPLLHNIYFNNKKELPSNIRNNLYFILVLVFYTYISFWVIICVIFPFSVFGCYHFLICLIC